MISETEHKAPWWFNLAYRFFPERCREIPEAQNPDRIVLRQLALIKRHLYLQQFASSEDPRWMHSHPWYRTIALGLWGSYTEERHGISRRVKAPYLYSMGPDVIHHAVDPSPGHTSIFLGLWRNDDLKHYFRCWAPTPWVSPRLMGRHWEDHVKVQVKRI